MCQFLLVSGGKVVWQMGHWNCVFTCTRCANASAAVRAMLLGSNGGGTVEVSLRLGHL